MCRTNSIDFRKNIYESSLYFAKAVDKCLVRIPNKGRFGPMKLLAIALLCVSLAAHAEKTPFDANINNTTLLNPSCPITLTGIYASSAHRGGASISLHFVNQTDKYLIAVKVALVGFDAAWDDHDFPEQYAIAVHLKPHREARPIWRVSADDFENDTASGGGAYLTKLVFSDGTTWADDGSKACSISILGLAKPTRHNDGD